jgi:hypothetical protein
MTKVSKVFEDRLRRQYERYPALKALRPMNNINTTFRKFYQQAKGIPFYRFDLSEVEHDELARAYDKGELNSSVVPCCFTDLISRPIDKNHNYRILYSYQAHMLARLGIQINNDFLLSSFVEKFKNDLFTPYELAEFEKNNIPISDIHKRPLNKNISIAKSTNLGMTELMIRAMLYKATVNDDLRGSTMCILVGPNFQLALGIMDRIRQLLGRKLGLVFDSAQDKIVLNGVVITAKPSHHIDTLRSLTNVSFILLSEAAFFPLQDTENILSTILRFRAKSDPWIVLESTVNRPGDMLDRCHNYPDSLEYQTFEKIRLPYTVGVNTIYEPDLILKQQTMPGFQREYNLQWIGTSSNIFSQQSIDRSITSDYDLRGIPQAPKAIGIDPNTGGKGSEFAFCLIQCAYNKIQILRAESFEAPIDFNDMVNHTIKLMRQYQNVKNIFVDAAVPVIYQGIARLLNQRLDYTEHVKELKDWRYTQEQIQRKLVVHPIPFRTMHKTMMANLKYFVDSNTLQIHPSFVKLIIGLRSASAIEYDYQKQESSYPDIIDATRLALQFVRPKQPIPMMEVYFEY